MNHHFDQAASQLRRTLLPILSLCLLAASAIAQVPGQISYQGRVLMNGTNFNGNGQFKFALVNNTGIVTFWSNNGTSVAGSEPSLAVTLPVANGLIMTLLGDTTLANMTTIPVTVFANADVRLRVWFNGGAGFQLLTPDQRIVSVGYAMRAETIPDGSITSVKLAPGAVTSNALANPLLIGSSGVPGNVHVYRNATGTPAISLLGGNSQISTYGSDGLEQARLHGISWGELLLNNSLANNANAVALSANGGSGGSLALKNTNGSFRAYLTGGNAGGSLTLYQADGGSGVFADGDAGGSGLIQLRSTNGSTRVNLYGKSPDSGGGEISVNDDDGSEVVEIKGNASGGQLTIRDETGSRITAFMGSSSVGGYQYLYNALGFIGIQLDGDSSGGGFLSVRSTNGSTRVSLDGETPTGGNVAVYEQDGTLTTLIHNVSDSGVVSVRNSVGAETVYLWGEQTDGTGDGQIGLKKASGTETITMQAGEGTGGAQILMRNAAGAQTVQLDSDAGGAGFLALYTTNGTAPIILDADASGDGRITTQVLQITGGSDLSENFDINVDKDTLLPGMIVSIDPKNVGELVLCHQAFDKKVAGIVSGAGGVKTGMLMGQAGTKADGKHPVALTGRVYCWVDADAGGPVEAGDLITTSNTPGHGMRVGESTRASGAIIGKAMSPLEKGKGLVLVLVSLQ